MTVRSLHYCKHCDCEFDVSIHEAETGDFFLICPRCGWRHYRYFEMGVAKHCEITKRINEPLNLMGVFL